MLLGDKVRKIDQLDATVHTLNVAMRRMSEENSRALEKIDNLDTDALRIIKGLEESFEKAQIRNDE